MNSVEHMTAKEISALRWLRDQLSWEASLARLHSQDVTDTPVRFFWTEEVAA
jgi:hypothetical protein